MQVTNIIANDDNVLITEDSAGASGNAVANDINVTSVVSASFGPSTYGVMSGNSDATWNYTLNNTDVVQALNPSQSLVDTISYDFIDSIQGPAGADIIITIQGVNDDPFTSSNTSYSIYKTQEDVEFTLAAEHALDVFGVAGVEAFFETTDGWDGPVLNDRPAPRYARHQPTSRQERELTDALLRSLSAQVQELHEAPLPGKG